MIARLWQFIENQDVSINHFEKIITASNGMIRRAIANNTDIQSKWLTIIAEKYPQLNIEWLITGKGNMLRSKLTTETLHQSTQQSEVIALLKEQLKEKEAELKESNQEIGQLKLKNKELEEKLMSLDLSGLSSSRTQAHSPDATSANVPLKK